MPRRNWQGLSVGSRLSESRWRFWTLRGVAFRHGRGLFSIWDADPSRVDPRRGLRLARQASAQLGARHEAWEEVLRKYRHRDREQALREFDRKNRFHHRDLARQCRNQNEGTRGRCDTGTRRAYESLQPVKNLTVSIAKDAEIRRDI